MVFRNSRGFIPSDAMAFTAADLPANSKTLTSGRINVLFFWQHDRWFHSLHVCQPDGTRAPASWQTAFPVPDDDPQWPSSPPLVEIAEVAGPQGTALVGLGKAGASHYSMSVTAGADGSLVFECACRLTTRPGWLGSTYVRRLWKKPAAAGCGDWRPPKTSAWGVAQVEKGRGWVFPRAVRADSVATGSPIVIRPLSGSSSAEFQTVDAQGGAQNHLFRISPSQEHDIMLAGQERARTGHGDPRLFGPSTGQHKDSEGFFRGPPVAYDGSVRHQKGGATIQWSYQARIADSG
jgi:hypothetical protein